MSGSVLPCRSSSPISLLRRLGAYSRRDQRSRPNLDRAAPAGRRLPKIGCPAGSGNGVGRGGDRAHRGKGWPDSRRYNPRIQTTQAGLKQFPSISPDGKWVVYESNQAGNPDIYLQSVGGQNAINLTKDSPDDDTQPAFSPDGESIAFRSERQGGGIFVMGRTGESVTRVTDGGYTPAWSPDGTQLVFATAAPDVFGMVPSEIWIVTLASGERNRLSDVDGIQASWSPHGHRIAYWAVLAKG